jgi:hypothetical protein
MHVPIVFRGHFIRRAISTIGCRVRAPSVERSGTSGIRFTS